MQLQKRNFFSNILHERAVQKEVVEHSIYTIFLLTGIFLGKKGCGMGTNWALCCSCACVWVGAHAIMSIDADIGAAPA